jgi:phosphopantetheinyl transferase
VERVKEKNWRIFHRYLSDQEIKMIEASDDPEACFFAVWTVKESFSKEEGMGLAILDEDFSIDHKINKISYSGKTLFFKSFEHTAEDAYRISICSPHEIQDERLYELTEKDWEDLIRVISDTR